jgi:DnaJ homolog subfamily C member 19
MPKSDHWIKAGGALGLAILVARVTRTPLAVILGALPFLLEIIQRTERRKNADAPPYAALTREEAALILGVSPQAEEEEIRDAHKRLIQKNHPDQGGTDYLAAKINQARDVLLK